MRIIYIPNDTMQSPHLIEPHAYLLNKPDENSKLYKSIFFRYFPDMLNRNYLYFNRVDAYKDDIRDSDAPDKDKEMFKCRYFIKNPNYSLYDYYNNCRSMTYACCFSIEKSSYIWKYGDMCMVFNSSNLINYFNNNYITSRIKYNDEYLMNYFIINYGFVMYGSLKDDILSKSTFPNPIKCAYFKDKAYSDDKEFRISLFWNTPGKPAYKGSEIIFPRSLELSFNIISAIQFGIINEILISNKSLLGEMSTLLGRHGLAIPINTN